MGGEAAAQQPAAQPDVLDVSLEADRAKADKSAQGGEGGQKADQSPLERSGIPRMELHRGGSTEKVALTDETRAILSHHIRDRFIIAQDNDLDPAKPRLNEYERLLLQKGEGFIDAIAGNEALSREDLALAWSVVTDELIQKSSTTHVDIVNQSGRFSRLREILGERRSVRRIVDRFSSADRIIVTPNEGPHFTSAYLDKMGYSTWDAERRASDLISLNEMRVNIEKQLGMSSDAEIPELREKTGDRIKDAAKEAADRILAREHNGITLLELQDRDPIKAAMVRQRAMQEGLTHFARESALQLLISEKPKVDAESIDAHIENLSKKKNDEEIEALQEREEESEFRFTQAQERFKKIRDTLTSAAGELETAQFDLQKAQATQDAQNPPIPGVAVGAPPREIEAYISAEDTAIMTYETDIANLPSTTMNAKEQERQKAVYRDLIDRARARKTELQRRKGELETAVAEARARVNHNTALITRLQGSAPGTTPPAGGGELGAAARTRDNARNDRDKAKRALKEANEGLTPEGEVKVDALKQWKIVGTDYEKIINERFGQRREDRLTAAKLGSILIDTSTGQVEGAERVREHLFRVTDAAWWAKPANKELARRLLSDEAIAKGIIETFRIDTGGKTIAVTTAPGVTTNMSYGDCFTAIDTARGDLDKALDKLAKAKAEKKTGAALTRVETEVRNARVEIQKYENPLLQAVLPYLKDANEFQIGDTMRYLVRHGLDAAAIGNPYYNGEAFVRPEAELTLEAESILQQHKGKVTFIETNMGGMGEAPRVQWEGEHAGINPAIFGLPPTYVDAAGNTHPYIDPTIDMTFRVTQNIDRGQVGASVDVLVNEQFLQALPDNLPAGVGATLPEEIRNLFYEQIGPELRLRTELRGRDRNTLQRFIASRRQQIDNRGNMWLAVRKQGELTTITAQEMLTDLDAELTPGAGINFAVATANTALAMNPSERLNILRGIDRIDTIAPFANLEKTSATAAGYSIDFDNSGRLWITEIDNNNVRIGPRQELSHFYDVQAESFRRRLGVQTLDAAQRDTLQADFRIIQERIGREALSAQQQR